MFKANRKKTTISQAEKYLKTWYDINDTLLFRSSFQILSNFQLFIWTELHHKMCKRTAVPLGVALSGMENRLDILKSPKPTHSLSFPLGNMTQLD